MIDFDLPEPEAIYPTPMVGDMVQWFNQAQRSSGPIALMVLKVESPGRITGLQFPPSGTPRTVSGCRYIGDPTHAKRNQDTLLQGAWEYREGSLPSKRIRLLGYNEMKRRRDIARKQAEEAAHRQNEAFLQRQREEDGTDVEAPVAASA